MSWKLVDRCETVSGWHLLGVRPWPWERFDLFKSKREQRLGCSQMHPPRQARITRRAPPLWMPSLFTGIITRQRLNNLAASPCCVTGFSYDWAWILHDCWHFENPCYGRSVKLGRVRTRDTDLLFHSSAAGPCLTQPAFKRAAPKAISIFI